MDDNYNIKTIRLSKTIYTRPLEGTITDKLQSPSEYHQKLKGYIEVSDIDYVSVRTHVRYFVYDIKQTKWMFRTGGLLTKKHAKYGIVANVKYSWSVQREINNGEDLYETKFFKILSKLELTEIALEKQQDEIQKLKLENSHLKSQIYSLHR